MTRDQMLGRLHAFGKGSDQSPFRETALRVIADFISVNASMILAFVLWYFFSRHNSKNTASRRSRHPFSKFHRRFRFDLVAGGRTNLSVSRFLFSNSRLRSPLQGPHCCACHHGFRRGLGAGRLHSLSRCLISARSRDFSPGVSCSSAWAVAAWPSIGFSNATALNRNAPPSNLIWSSFSGARGYLGSALVPMPARPGLSGSGSRFAAIRKRIARGGGESPQVRINSR